jgi:hypothetical protein
MNKGVIIMKKQILYVLLLVTMLSACTSVGAANNQPEQEHPLELQVPLPEPEKDSIPDDAVTVEIDKFSWWCRVYYNQGWLAQGKGAETSYAQNRKVDCIYPEGASVISTELNRFYHYKVIETGEEGRHATDGNWGGYAKAERYCVLERSLLDVMSDGEPWQILQKLENNETCEDLR